MKVRKILTTVTALLMTATLTGCSGFTSNAGGKNDAVILKVWAAVEEQAPDQGRWLQTMCNNFNELHPELNVIFKYGICSEGEIGSIISENPTDTADVYVFANDQLGLLLEANSILKLEDEVAEEVKNNNEQVVVDSVSVTGDIYGIPITTNTWFMYYNKEIFNEQDITSLDKVLEKAKVAFPMSTAWYNGSFFIGNGGTMFGDGTKANEGIDFGGEKGLEIMSYLVDLVNNKNFINDIDGGGIYNFNLEKIGAYFSGSWDYESVKTALGDKLGVAQLPTFNVNGKDVQLKSFAGSKAVGVNPNCENLDVALEFARYLGGAESQKAHYELRSVIPCSIELLKDPEIAGNELIKAQNDTIKNTSIVQPTLSQMSTYFQASEAFGNKLVNGEITHENAEMQLENYIKELNNY